MHLDDNFVPAAALDLLTAATKAQVLKAPEPDGRPLKVPATQTENACSKEDTGIERPGMAHCGGATRPREP